MEAPEITDAQHALISASEEAVAEIKAAQELTARLQGITRWAFAAVGAVAFTGGWRRSVVAVGQSATTGEARSCACREQTTA